MNSTARRFTEEPCFNDWITNQLRLQPARAYCEISRHIGVSIEKVHEKVDDFPICQLWLSAGQSGLDPHDEEVLNPAVLPSCQPQHKVDVAFSEFTWALSGRIPGHSSITMDNHWLY